MTTAKPAFKMLPYRRQGEIDYASLEFAPDITEKPPDRMEQNREIREITGLLAARFTEFDTRLDVFLDDDSFICYDPDNLNIRIAPDVYLAFGVDATAIRPRRIYLPWEVGKPPDFAMEIASQSTARVDADRKPLIYAAIGVPEFWLFDPSGGRYYGQELWGGQLVGGAYRSLPLTREPDGILKAYSPVLQVSICWDDGWPRLYDPAAGAYDEGWREVWHARRAAEEQAAIAERQRDAAEVARLAVEMENERLREELRRLRAGE